MVDVSAKQVTAREAVARGEVTMRPETLAAIAAGALPKGDVLAVARLAGIMAAKRTADLVPLCHPLPLSHVDVELTPDPSEARVRIEGRVRVEARTGVEMEALTAVAVAGVPPYDTGNGHGRQLRTRALRPGAERGGPRRDDPPPGGRRCARPPSSGAVRGRFGRAIRGSPRAPPPSASTAPSRASRSASSRRMAGSSPRATPTRGPRSRSAC